MMARSRTSVAWVLGGILLVAFIPIHIQLWARFPVWYHLAFLGTLIPLVVLGAALTQSSSRNGPAKTAL